MLSLLLTWQVSVPLSILLALFAVSSWSEMREIAALRRLTPTLLVAAVPRLASLQTTPTSPDARLVPELEDLQDHLREHVIGLDEGKPVLSRSVASLVDEWIDARVDQGLPSLLGTSFTGIALIFTFALIAWVLFEDVHNAIMRSADGSAGSAAPLADAVAKMGTKFVISCVGILLAIFHQFSSRMFRASARKESRRIGRALEPAVTDRASLDLRRSQEVVASLSALRSAIEHEEATLGEKLGMLSHIEVSVDNLGAQVSENLGTLMKDTLAEEVKLLLADVRTIAEGIEDRLSRTLEGNVQSLAQSLGYSLDALRVSFESQPTSQVEKVLEAFSNSMTGGLSNETKNMSGMLESFQATIPKLGENIAAMTEQMQVVLEQMRDQQTQSQQLMSAIASSTSESVARLGSDFAKQGSDAMTHVLEETNSRIERMVRGLDAAASHNSGSTATIRADMEIASAKVGQLTEALGTSLSRVTDIIGQVDSALKTSSRSVLALAEGSTSLKGAAEGVRIAVVKSDETRARMEGLLGQQVELATKLSHSLGEMQKVYPHLLKEIGAAMQTSSSAVNDSWTRLSQQLQQVTARYGTEVGERVEGLSTAVEVLVKEIRNLPAAGLRR